MCHWFVIKQYYVGEIPSFLQKSRHCPCVTGFFIRNASHLAVVLCECSNVDDRAHYQYLLYIHCCNHKYGNQWSPCAIMTCLGNACVCHISVDMQQSRFTDVLSAADHSQKCLRAAYRLPTLGTLGHGLAIKWCVGSYTRP